MSHLVKPRLESGKIGRCCVDSQCKAAECGLTNSTVSRTQHSGELGKAQVVVLPELFREPFSATGRSGVFLIFTLLRPTITVFSRNRVPHGGCTGVLEASFHHQAGKAEFNSI